MSFNLLNSWKVEGMKNRATIAHACGPIIERHGQNIYQKASDFYPPNWPIEYRTT